MLRYLPLIVRNAWRNRRRTTLTILSVGISMCLVGVLMAVYYAFYLSDPTPEQALRLVTRNRVSLTFAMPQSYRERIRQVPGVREVMISQWYGGTYKDSRDPKNMFARFAIEPEKLFTIYGELHIPEEQKQAFLHERTACVISRDLARNLGARLGDRITLTGDIFPGTMEFTVLGIFDIPRRSDVLYFNREYLEESLPERRRGNAGTFVILMDKPDSASRIANEIDEMFRNSTVQTRTETEQAFVLSFVSFLGNVKMFLIGICAAVLFTILLVSANTMAMSVRERVREVGVLKTLGFTRSAILGLMLGESCAISIIGGLIGFALSIMLTQAVSRSPFGGFLPTIRPLQPAVAAACVGTALAIGVISSLIPAWNASGTPIVTALRSTD